MSTKARGVIEESGGMNNCSNFLVRRVTARRDWEYPFSCMGDETRNSAAFPCERNERCLRTVVRRAMKLTNKFVSRFKGADAGVVDWRKECCRPWERLWYICSKRYAAATHLSLAARRWRRQPSCLNRAPGRIARIEKGGEGQRREDFHVG